MAFNWGPTFYLLGIIFIATALFAIVIGITAKKIDFSDRLFSLKDRKTQLPRKPVGDKAIAAFADTEETKSRKMKRKEKSKRAKKSLPSPRPSSSGRMGDIEPVKDEKYYEEMAERVTLAGREHAPKYDDEADEVEMLGKPEEMAKMVDEDSLGEEAEKEVIVGISRDLSIMIPENMCLDEVFRLKITLIRDDQFDDKVTIEKIIVDKESAEYFSMNVTKLGEKVIEATTRIHGLEKGALIVRPIAIGHVAALAPQQRTIYFHPELDEIVIDFFITPTKWSKDLNSNIRIEFEQNYRILRTIDIPIKIYKRKMEAIFGINISKWQTIVLFAYSAFGTLSGLISFFWDSFVPWITNLFGVS